ncbi:MAG: diguanylate cyclase [Bacillota bacterium]|jgi:diguanylate cyclase (GGDEF)-like protein
MFNDKEKTNKISAISFLVCIILAAAFDIYAIVSSQLPTAAEASASLFGQCAAAVFLAVNLILVLQTVAVRLRLRAILPTQLETAVCLGSFVLLVLTEALLSSDFFSRPSLDFTAHQILLLMFIPYLVMLNNLTEQKGLLKISLCALLTVNLLVQNILNLSGIVSLEQLLRLTDAFNIICLLIGFYLFFEGRNQNLEHYLFLGIGSLSFALLYFLEIIAAPGSRLFFLLGFSCFTAAVYCLNLQKAKTAVQNTAKEEILRQQAMLDYQTGYGSRLAFDKYYYNLENYHSGVVSIGVMVIDLNNLKETNDTYGNAAGDELIKATASCISEIFGGEAKCFRTGGDEFAVLAVNTSLDMEALMNQLDGKIIEYNAQNVRQLSIARGLCIDEAEVSDERKLRIIYKAADDRMYTDKIQKHEQMKVQMIQEKYLKKQMLQEQMIREKQFQEQMKKVAEAKQAEDRKKQEGSRNPENQPEEKNQPADQNKRDDFWGENSSKSLFGKNGKKQKTDNSPDKPTAESDADTDELTQTEKSAETISDSTPEQPAADISEKISEPQKPDGTPPETDSFDQDTARSAS